jgi:hypothetical protein
VYFRNKVVNTASKHRIKNLTSVGVKPQTDRETPPTGGVDHLCPVSPLPDWIPAGVQSIFAKPNTPADSPSTSDEDVGDSSDQSSKNKKIKKLDPTAHRLEIGHPMKTEAKRTILAVEQYRHTGVIPEMLLHCVDFPPEALINPCSRIYHERDTMNQIEVLASAEHFRQIGKIPTGLTTLYDQDGNWVGKHHPYLSVIDYELQCRLQCKTLHESRRHAFNKEGQPILLTSFVAKSQHRTTLKWHAIKGFVRVNTKAEIEAPNLRTVGLSIFLKHPAKVRLPNLRQAFSLDTGDDEEIHVPNLTRVESLNSCVKAFNAPSLESVGFDLILQFANTVSLPRLRTVGDDLFAEAALVFHAPCLEFVGGQRAIRGHAPVLSPLTADS